MPMAFLWVFCDICYINKKLLDRFRSFLEVCMCVQQNFNSLQSLVEPYSAKLNRYKHTQITTLRVRMSSLRLIIHLMYPFDIFFFVSVQYSSLHTHSYVTLNLIQIIFNQKYVYLKLYKNN